MCNVKSMILSFCVVQCEGLCEKQTQASVVAFVRFCILLVSTVPDVCGFRS